MNSIACVSTDAELHCTAQVATESYATAAIPVVLPAYQPPSEEELHSGFEEAISQRASIMHARLERLSSQPYTIYRETGPLQPSRTYLQALHCATRTLPAYTVLQKATIFACLALMFLLLGFNLMGLLILHIH